MMKPFVLMCSMLALTGMHPPAAIGQTVQQDTFDGYKKTFQDKAKAQIDSFVVDHWKNTSFYITKIFAADLVSNFVQQSQVTTTVTFPKQNVHIDTINITTAHQDLPDCSGSRWPCNSDCGWNLGCILEKGKCEANKKANMMICEGQKAALQLISDKKLGVINMGDPQVDAEAHITLQDVRLSPTFDNVAITGRLIGEGSLRGQINFTPEIVTFVVCLPHSDTIHPPLSMHINQTPTISAALTFSPAKPNLNVTIKPDEFSLQLTFDSDPLIQLVNHNPQLWITCSLPTALGVTYSLIKPIRTVDKKIDLPSFPIVISPITVGIGSDTLLLAPSLTDKAVGFVVSTQ
jgi:hypothetical protein